MRNHFYNKLIRIIDHLRVGHIHVHVPEVRIKRQDPFLLFISIRVLHQKMVHQLVVQSSLRLLSLGLNKPIKQNVAMTGELSLTGRVLPVGGIKEKVIAVCVHLSIGHSIRSGFFF